MVWYLKKRLSRFLSRSPLRLYGKKLWRKRRQLAIIATIAILLWLATSFLKKEEQLVSAKPMTTLAQELPIPLPKRSSGQYKLLLQGDRISLNGQTWPATWSKWQIGTNRKPHIAVTDAGLKQTMGVELLSSWDLTKQAAQWFTDPSAERLTFPTLLTNQYRYLDITDFADRLGWQMLFDGTTLRIKSPTATVTNIQQEQPSKNGEVAVPHRIILDLDLPTPWQVSQQGAVLSLHIDAAAAPGLMERYYPKPPQPTTDEQGFPLPYATTEPIPPPNPGLPLRVETSQNKTTIRVDIPPSLHPRIWSVPAPYRLVIDLATDEVIVERDIIWATGLRYRQQMFNLGSSQFPVMWLEINPRQSIMLRPIWSNPNTLVGITPLIEQAKQWQVAAAINGGFFNRNTQLPLGAIRRDGLWLSSPILNRGAIAWNDSGEVKIGHLSLQQVLITSTGERLPVLSVNSGYLQSGIAVHTSEWGSTYAPLTENETIITVENDRVISVEPFSRIPLLGNALSKTSFPIPAEGYLLVVRDNSSADVLPVGTIVRLESYPVPLEFDRYPQVMGAGPLLLQNRQIVLNAKAEQFRDNFIHQAAHRSCIGTTASGTILIVAVGNRIGGPGPTLNEIAELMRLMGAVDALNLDGGSSTSLYLGGQLLNRSPRTAARVHNGLGVFIQTDR